MRHLQCFTEHLARSGKIEAAFRMCISQGRQQKVRAIDVCVQRGEFVFEGIAHEALRSEMKALIGLHINNRPVNAWKTLKRSGMQLDIVQKIFDPPHAVGGIFKRDPSHDAMNLISLCQKEFCEVGAILAGDTCYESARHSLLEPMETEKTVTIWTRRAVVCVSIIPLRAKNVKEFVSGVHTRGSVRGAHTGSSFSQRSRAADNSEDFTGLLR